MANYKLRRGTSSNSSKGGEFGSHREKKRYFDRLSNQLISYGLTVLRSYGLSMRSYALLAVFCLLGFFAGAQSVVSYQYDDAGNRIHRVINMQSFTPPPQDSTENVVETPEDFFADVQEDTEDEIEDDELKSQKVYTDVLSETLITIYPNPTAGLLTVKIANLPQQSVSSLTLFDMLGRVITQQQLSDENKLDISAQPVGTYIMRIAVGEETTSWTIIKQ